LRADREGAWLEPDLAEAELASLLVPAEAGQLTARDVGDAVNNVREDGPHLIEARAPQPQLF
jgi:putative SOS response-associated peptidase YedK